MEHAHDDNDGMVMMIASLLQFSFFLFLPWQRAKWKLKETQINKNKIQEEDNNNSNNNKKKKRKKNAGRTPKTEMETKVNRFQKFLRYTHTRTSTFHIPPHRHTDTEVYICICILAYLYVYLYLCRATGRVEYILSFPFSFAFCS